MFKIGEAKGLARTIAGDARMLIDYADDVSDDVRAAIVERIHEYAAELVRLFESLDTTRAGILTSHLQNKGTDRESPRSIREVCDHCGAPAGKTCSEWNAGLELGRRPPTEGPTHE